MNKKEENLECLENISEELSVITDSMTNLKKDTARVIIKQLYYSCFLNVKRFEDMYDELMEFSLNTEAAFREEMNREIASSSIENAILIIRDEIDKGKDVNFALLLYLIKTKEIQTILQEDLPALVKFNKTLEENKIEFDDISTARLCCILEAVSNDADLEDIDLDEFFELINFRVETYLSDEGDIKRFIECSHK